jgi:hypothetical protein
VGGFPGSAGQVAFCSPVLVFVVVILSDETEMRLLVEPHWKRNRREAMATYSRWAVKFLVNAKRVFVMMN